MKPTFFPIIIILFLCSCKIVDPPLNCNIIDINVKFNDSIRGLDLTGDSILLPIIKYDKDSINYMVVSNFDTTSITKAEVNKSGFYNMYSLKYYFGNNYGLYKIIFLLNSVDSDTISVKVIDNYKLEYYYKNVLIQKEDGDCGYLNYIINK